LAKEVVWAKTKDVPRAPSSVYLSPDATVELEVDGPSLPSYIVVGGLVDRTVTPGRSLRMAQNAELNARQLPLSGLSLEELESTEALNIDTVCEMCAGWRIEVDKGGEVKEGWRKAAVKAMLRHQDRHPNRVLHKDGGKIKQATS